MSQGSNHSSGGHVAAAMSGGGNSSSSSNKLNPIYLALENHQYSRAIKLCLAQVSVSPMAKALLAHAYAKSGQRYKALLTVQSILGKQHTVDYFPELRLEIVYSLEHRHQDSALPSTTSSISGSTPPSSSVGSIPASGGNKKAAKKGKKKGGGAIIPATSLPSGPATAIATGEHTVSPSVDNWDLIEQLDTPPILPDNWEILPPAVDAITDHHLLNTISVTMINQLRLPLTAYQTYCWAVSKAPTDETLVSRAFLSGLAVLVAPQYPQLTRSILTNMQVLALQLARIQQGSYGTSPAIAWAAQTALWQVQLSSSNFASNHHHQMATNGNVLPDPKEQQRLSMLPRLAESFAYKAVYSVPTLPKNIEDPLMMAEDFVLYIRTLELQGKFDQIIEAIDQKLFKGGEQMAPTKQTLLDLKSNALLQFRKYDEAQTVLEELLSECPDDWRYWLRHLQSSIRDDDGCSSTMDSTRQYADSIMEKAKGQQYTMRAPLLIRVEMAKRCHSESTFSNLWNAVKDYGDILSGQASCVFSDLTPYFDELLETCTLENARELLRWAAEKRIEPAGSNPKERRELLRRYIFGVQVAYKVLQKFDDLLDSDLPPWQELMRVWLSFESLEEKDQAQKESRPADDLVLLAVQQLLFFAETTDNTTLRKRMLVTSTCLLEVAMKCSPYNPYMKITAILIYGQLNSPSRAWELSKALHIKHIQHESCAYLILPILQAGGFYRETISVCQEILRLQTTAIRDAGEYSSRAMEHGTTSKADEIVAFHRCRMNMSLTTLEAKGLILDSAPMFIHDEQHDSLGSIHGIVGGDFDVERAYQMVAEAHNPCAAFSLLRIQGSLEEISMAFSDNRDFTIFSHDILFRRQFDSTEKILSDSMRRGHHHRLLIRASLCVETTKGPKKGKLVKCSTDQEKRCKSLLASVQECHTLNVDDGYGNVLAGLHAMCQAIVCLGAGLYQGEQPEIDTLEAREQRVSDLFLVAAGALESARKSFNLDSDISIATVSRLLPDCVITVFALFRMCVKVADLFGWAPRKQKVKPCAAAMAGLLSTLAGIVNRMKDCMKR